MKWNNYHRLLAVACLLLTSSLVQGANISQKGTAGRPAALRRGSGTVPNLRARQTASNPPSATSTSLSTSSLGQTAGAPFGLPPGGVIKIDPINGGFLGGNPPDTTTDLPVTIVFLVLFAAGAVTHISIYTANAKRGHKFLLSDLMFDFCLMRSLACVFRILWIFTQLRGIILGAQIFFNGGYVPETALIVRSGMFANEE